MWWEQVRDTLQDEFSDLGGVEDITIVVLRLLVAVLLGALLGYERESIQATAGLRTHMLVSLGSALFVLIPLRAGMEMNQLGRVIQGVGTGVGFLGAGAIIKHTSENDIKGLTTAAGVWLTAIVSAAFAFVILTFVRRFTKR